THIRRRLEVLSDALSNTRLRIAQRRERAHDVVAQRVDEGTARVYLALRVVADLEPRASR
ncbi:hypothetical protein NY486_06245, partial [Enterobacter hormaechei]|nr:hypothetical protein [Enterobacter hormaechei]